ncbi:cytochrome P450 67 [Pyrenochaeta sp. DS3sAY3a]|nr:cytochrome P450 67 [Pyrenochaeta sp. DS3sAY3a]
MSTFIPADTSQVIQTSAILGICFHIAIARPSFEFEQYMFKFLALAGILQLSGTYLSLAYGGQSFTRTLVQSFLVWLGFSTGLFSSITVYRLFLHRCKAYPGPLAAKISRLYATYLTAGDTQFYQVLGRLHEKHGDYVRVGPREISILDPAAIPLIYGPNTKCTRSTWYIVAGQDSDKVSLTNMRDGAKVRLRKRAWDRGLSFKALNTYQARVKAQTDELLNQLRIHAGQPMNVSKWSMFYTFDVMGDLGFGKPFSNMVTGKEHPGIHAMHKHLWVLGVVATISWFPRLLSAIPGSDVGLAEFLDLCAGVLKDKLETYDSSKEPRDIVSWLLKAVKDGDVSAPPTKEALADESRSVIIAGSDTAGIALANILFYLAKYQDKQKKLRELLDAANPGGLSTWDYATISTVTYIDDIINETLRLKSPVIQGMPRETPPPGLQIGEKWIPGYVNVSVPVTLIQRDPRWWKQPNEFIPERWTERREEMGTEGAPWFPFQLGPHACPGRNLAYMLLRTSLSTIFRGFEVSFAPGETGVKFDGEYLSSLMMILRPLNLVFTPRNAN